MNNENAVCSIEHLPYEVLCKIFDKLDISSVKCCSRTCKRWKETIFSDYYIKRFKLTLDISGLSSQSIHSLEQSDRLYCNMTIQLRSQNLRSYPLFNVIYCALSYPKLEQLVTLKITHDVTKNRSLIMMLTDAIARMKVLRELYIDNHHRYPFTNYCNTLKIRSNSIELLDLECVISSDIKAPKLSSLRISGLDSNQNFQHNAKRIFLCRSRNLKSLEIDEGLPPGLSTINNIQNVLRFFQHHQSLQTLNLKNVEVKGYLFKTICKNCTDLTEFSIDTLTIMKTCALQNLSNLSKLRHLQVTNINCLEPASFDFVKLPNLESLGIGCFPMLYQTLDAFKSATKITILSFQTTTDFMSAIAIKMPKLKHIELRHVSRSKIESLNLFENLEVLSVGYDLGNLHGIQCNIIKIKQIHCLNATGITHQASYAWLLRYFPKLQLLATPNFKIRFPN